MSCLEIIEASGVFYGLEILNRTYLHFATRMYWGHVHPNAPPKKKQHSNINVECLFCLLWWHPQVLSSSLFHVISRKSTQKSQFQRNEAKPRSNLMIFSAEWSTTPLGFACLFGSGQLVKLLLEQKGRENCGGPVNLEKVYEVKVRLDVNDAFCFAHVLHIGQYGVLTLIPSIIKFEWDVQSLKSLKLIVPFFKGSFLFILFYVP